MTAGLQESRTTGVEVTLYPYGDDLVLANPGAKISLSGKSNAPEQAPSVTSAQFSKSLGEAAGSFTLEVRAPFILGNGKPDLMDRLVDDDWVDLVFTVNGKKTHVCRGQIDTVTRHRGTGAMGAQSRAYTITGRDHGRVFAMTPIWFNEFRAENAGGQETIKLLESRTLGGAPDETVRRLLFGFLSILGDKGRVNLTLPSSMQASNALLGSLKYAPEHFTQAPKRTAATLMLDSSSGTPIWNLAQEWSDPMFCELWCDLGQKTPDAGAPGYLPVDKNCDVGDTAMRVFFRNKPFPTQALGASSLWFDLPTLEVPEQYVSSVNTGRGGSTRYNAFVVSPQLLHEASRIDLQGPLWDEKDIAKHGLRQFTVDSRYVADEADLYTMSSQQRVAARDWHVMNPYLYTGTVEMGALFPALRVGMRLRIRRERPGLDEIYYVEQVSHRWSPNTGGRTTATVTRGWMGNDSSYWTALENLTAGYTHLGGPEK